MRTPPQTLDEHLRRMVPLSYHLLWSWLPRWCFVHNKWLIQLRFAPKSGSEIDVGKAHYCWKKVYGVHKKG